MSIFRGIKQPQPQPQKPGPWGTFVNLKSWDIRLSPEDRLSQFGWYTKSYAFFAQEHVVQSLDLTCFMRCFFDVPCSEVLRKSIWFHELSTNFHIHIWFHHDSIMQILGQRLGGMPKSENPYKWHTIIYLYMNGCFFLIGKLLSTQTILIGYIGLV